MFKCVSNHDAMPTKVILTEQVEGTCYLGGGAPMTLTVEVQYKPATVLLELISFKEWLAATAVGTTVEEFTQNVRRTILDATSCLACVVTVHAKTEMHGPVTVIVGGDA